MFICDTLGSSYPVDTVFGQFNVSFADRKGLLDKVKTLGTGEFYRVRPGHDAGREGITIESNRQLELTSCTKRVERFLD